MTNTAQISNPRDYTDVLIFTQNWFLRKSLPFTNIKGRDAQIKQVKTQNLY